MKSLLTLVGAGLLSAASLLPLRAESLSDLVSQAGLEWLIGRWEARSESGPSTTLAYEWRLEKNAVAVHFDSPDMASEGLIGRNPKSGDVGYVGINNRGGGAMGRLTAEDGRLRMDLKTVTGEGKEGRLAIIHEKVDEDTMKVILRRVGEDGQPGDVMDTVQFKRVRQ